MIYNFFLKSGEKTLGVLRLKKLKTMAEKSGFKNLFLKRLPLSDLKAIESLSDFFITLNYELKVTIFDYEEPFIKIMRSVLEEFLKTLNSELNLPPLEYDLEELEKEFYLNSNFFMENFEVKLKSCNLKSINHEGLDKEILKCLFLKIYKNYER